MFRTILTLALLLNSGCVVPLHVASDTDLHPPIRQAAAETDNKSGVERPDYTWQQFKDDATLALWTPYMFCAAALYFTTGIGGPPL